MYTMWWCWSWVLEVAYASKTLDKWISTLSRRCPWRLAARSWIKRGSFDNKQIWSHRSSCCPEDIPWHWERIFCCQPLLEEEHPLWEVGLGRALRQICGVGASVAPQKNFALPFWWAFPSLLRALAMMVIWMSWASLCSWWLELGSGCSLQKWKLLVVGIFPVSWDTNRASFPCPVF